MLNTETSSKNFRKKKILEKQTTLEKKKSIEESSSDKFFLTNGYGGSVTKSTPKRKFDIFGIKKSPDITRYPFTLQTDVTQEETDFKYIKQLCNESGITILNLLKIPDTEEIEVFPIDDNDLNELDNNLDESKESEEDKKEKEKIDDNEKDKLEEIESEESINMVTKEQKMLDELQGLEDILKGEKDILEEMNSFQLSTPKKKPSNTFIFPTLHKTKINSFLTPNKSNVTSKTFFSSFTPQSYQKSAIKEKKKIEKLQKKLDSFYDNCQDEISKLDFEKQILSKDIYRMNKCIKNGVIKMNNLEIPLSTLNRDFKYYKEQRFTLF